MKNYISSIFNNKKKPIEKRNDNFYNPSTAIGDPEGRVEGSNFVTQKTLSKRTLTNLYRGDGITRRVVSLIVEDSLRKFIEAEMKLINELNRLLFKQVLSECATFARLYGGALIVAYVDDGAIDMSMPVNMKRVRKVVKLVSYERHQVTWSNDDINQDYYDVANGQPNIYTITPTFGSSFRVHRSRVYRMGSIITPSDAKINNGHWDDSAIQPVYSSLLNYGLCRGASSEIAQDFVQKVLKVQGLSNTLRFQDNAVEEIQTRLAVLDANLSVSKTLAVDAEIESYEKHSSSVSGISELWDRFSESMCASSGIPMSRLFSRNPSGLTNNNNGDDDHWHSVVDAYRKDDIAPCVDWLIGLLKVQLIWEEDKRPLHYNWEFPSLKETSDEEMSKVKHLIAQVDSIYVNMGAIEPRVLYALRYATGTFQASIKIPKDYLESLKAEEDIDTEGNEDLEEPEEVEVEAVDQAKISLMNTIGKKL